MLGHFSIVKKCKTTNARVSELQLNNNKINTPVFMPVATYGAMRGVRYEHMPEEIILSNTYHLRNLNKDVKNFMEWSRSLLTDSGGFQINSLPNVNVNDEGVVFDNKLFTPEDSMDIQISLGADIIMQLDDVVNPKEERSKHEVAVKRSIEWLDRAINHIRDVTQLSEHNKSKLINEVVQSTETKRVKMNDNPLINNINKDDIINEIIQSTETKRIKLNDNPLVKNINKDNTINEIVQSTEPKRIKLNDNPSISNLIGDNFKQILFPIIQGGLIDEIRQKSIDEILKRNPIGLAIGGLSGGENKEDFCNTVFYCCNNLPENIPRYLMGVGYPEDIVVCTALGVDMADCVYPTRTARFGRAFKDTGYILIDNKVIADITPIDNNCECMTCKKYSKAFISNLKGTSGYCQLLSVHNLFYMRRLTERIRNSIKEDKFPEFIKRFMGDRYKESVPEWIRNALLKVNVII